MDYEKLLEIEPYSLNSAEKQELLTKYLKKLTEHHLAHCDQYYKILQSLNYDSSINDKINSYYDIPFLPVRLFKEMNLLSIEKEDVFKTMTSSGTTGQKVSKIFLDKETASNQQKTLVKIVSSFTGAARMPMLIIDCPSVIKNRQMFSARGAGILGFSIFGTERCYALTDQMCLNFDSIKEFLMKHKGKPILLFGFTFMIWQHFYKELVKMKNEKGITIDLSNSIMIHGGGWKKLISEAVTPYEFHDAMHNICGLNRIHDYYGMVEQTGCVYMQCECGHLHASIFSDVIIRRPLDFKVCDINELGIIQVVSCLPKSYPGHSLLTEDEGILLGEDNCPCGRKGKYFSITGRIAKAEIRGCSDTYANSF